jgi:hypothetical protein
MQWEYDHCMVQDGDIDYVLKINGEDEWELVYYSRGPATTEMVFKRPRRVEPVTNPFSEIDPC